MLSTARPSGALPRVAATTLAAAGVVLAAFNVASGAALWWSVYQAQPPAGTDYLALFAGATLFAQDPSRLYDIAAQQAVQEAVVHPGRLAAGVLPYPYPPHVAALLAVPAALGYGRSFALLGAVNLVVMALAVAVIARRAGLRRSGALWLVTIAAASLPVAFTVVQGQVSLAVLLLMSLFVFDHRDGRSARAGLWLGLLAFKPQLLVVPVLLMVRARQWRGLLTGVGVVALTWLPTLPRVGLSAAEGYGRLLLALGSAHDTLGVHPDRMFNLRALGAALLSEPWSALGWAVAVSVTLLLVGRRSTVACRDRGAAHLRLAAAVIAALLVSPHLNLHDLALLVLVAGLLLAGNGRALPLGAAAGALALVALPLPVVVLAPDGAAAAMVPAVLAAVFLALVWLSERRERLPAGPTAEPSASLP